MAIKNYFAWQVKKEMTPDEIVKDWQRNVPQGGEVFDSKKLFQYPYEQQENSEQSSSTAKKEGDITNLDAAWKMYDRLEQAKYKNDYNNGVLPYIKKGTILRLPATELTLVIKDRINKDRHFAQTDYQTLWSQHYEDVINDETYVGDKTGEHAFENITTQSEQGLVTQIIPINARVYIYCKAINSIIDVSPFLMSLSTDKTLETGSFNITLAPFRNPSIQKIGSSYIEVFNTITSNKYHIKDFIEKFCQFNDIVFIRFERLQKEQDSESDTLIIEKENLPSDKNLWDMIGFVDKCSIHTGAEDTSRYISIDGRDMSKLLEDDGSYFLPLKDVSGSDQFTIYGDNSSLFFQRNALTGCYDFIWTSGFKTITETIWFIINVCSNLGIVKEDLFSAWKERRTKSFHIDGVREMTVNGIWQIVQVYLDEACTNRILVDSSFGNPNGTLMSLMQRVCQQPFIEFFFDTYKDTIDLTVRQPPHNKKAISEIIEAKTYITIEARDVYDMSLDYDTRFYSWYQVYAQNSWTANTKETSLAMVPIIFIPEYAQYFGNKKLEVGDIYLHVNGKKDNKDITEQVNYQRAALNDLLYLVESTAYLPFTRRGTITLCGDRRIKVGTFIKNEATNELFYVIGVTNTVEFSDTSIDRRTILNVERGMNFSILNHADPKFVGRLRKDNSFPGTDIYVESSASIQGKNFQPDYFSIVDIEWLRQAIESIDKSGNPATSINSKATVVKEQFEYFLNRKMFEQ